MFVAGISLYAALIFSFSVTAVAVPSAIKVFNWTATLYKGSIHYDAPMLYAFGFIGLFTMGGLTGLFLAALGIDVHVTDTYFVVAHFHYIMVGGVVMGYLGGMHFWWPKISGRMYPEGWARLAALIVFIGFNLTFFPQFILGYMGMPRRYCGLQPHARVPGAERALYRGRDCSRRRLSASHDLLPVVDALRQARARQSLERGRPGMDDFLAAARPSILKKSPSLPGKPTTTTSWSASQGGGSRCPIAPSSAVHHEEHITRHCCTISPNRSSSTMPPASACGSSSATEVMFFGGMFCAYLIYRRWYFGDFAAASKSIDAALGATNTAVLICSSLTVVLAVWAAQTGEPQASDRQPRADHAARMVFLGIKGIEYKDKFEEHHVPGASFSFDHDARFPAIPISTPIRSHAQIFFSLYFIMTGLHALHMIIGLGIFAWLFLHGLERPFHARISHAHRNRRTLLALRRHRLDLSVPVALPDRPAPVRSLCSRLHV